jgi:hypothetical protein
MMYRKKKWRVGKRAMKSEKKQEGKKKPSSKREDLMTKCERWFRDEADRDTKELANMPIERMKKKKCMNFGKDTIDTFQRSRISQKMLCGNKKERQTTCNEEHKKSLFFE